MKDNKYPYYKFSFDIEKNCKLIDQRGINLEEIIAILEKGQILDVLEHKNKKRYRQQKIYIIEFNNYILEVPFIRNGNEIFLKTTYRNREMAQIYLQQKSLKGENIK